MVSILSFRHYNYNINNTTEIFMKIDVFFEVADIFHVSEIVLHPDLAHYIDLMKLVASYLIYFRTRGTVPRIWSLFESYI